jgi:hypothetical protein
MLSLNPKLEQRSVFKQFCPSEGRSITKIRGEKGTRRRIKDKAQRNKENRDNLRNKIL